MSSTITRRRERGVASRSRTAAARTVLLVDDDDQFRSSLADFLRADGHRVLEACNGEAALAELARRRGSPPDLIIVDLLMPKVSGLELLQRLRHFGRHRSVPVMMVTGLDDPMLPVRVDVPVVVKTDIDTLCACVRERLAQR